MAELNDPFARTTCAKCGLPVETSGFNVVLTKTGPVFGRNASPRWEHNIVNFTRSEIDAATAADADHEGVPADGRSHEDDAQRLEHNVNMEQFKEHLALSKQFAGVFDPELHNKCANCGTIISKDQPEDHLGMCTNCADAFYSGKADIIKMNLSNNNDLYKCRVCGKRSATAEENMNHTCFE